VQIILVGRVPEAVARVQTLNHASKIMLIDDLVEMMPPAALHQPFKHWVLFVLYMTLKGFCRLGKAPSKGHCKAKIGLYKNYGTVHVLGGMASQDALQGPDDGVDPTALGRR
jgi:hypothetical protein